MAYKPPPYPPVPPPFVAPPAPHTRPSTSPANARSIKPKAQAPGHGNDLLAGFWLAASSVLAYFALTGLGFPPHVTAFLLALYALIVITVWLLKGLDA
jgi:hypothetical protein